MILRDLVSCLSRVTVAGPLDQDVSSLTASSREVRPGVLFAAIRGTTIDGHKFIHDALAAGATAILAESAPPVDLPGIAGCTCRTAAPRFPRSPRKWPATRGRISRWPASPAPMAKPPPPS
jgi:UDP-N-acetylmuramyl tripeptide synthase